MIIKLILKLLKCVIIKLFVIIVFDESENFVPFKAKSSLIDLLFDKYLLKMLYHDFEANFE